MKRNTAKTLSLFAILALATTAGYAQQITVLAKVPFEFTVGKQTLPAGEYIIQRLTPSALIVSNRNNRFSTVLLPESLSSSLEGSNPKLKFERTNGQSALSEIWADSTGYKVQIPKRTFTVAQNPAENPVVQADLAAVK